MTDLHVQWDSKLPTIRLHPKPFTTQGVAVRASVAHWTARAPKRTTSFDSMWVVILGRESALILFHSFQTSQVQTSCFRRQFSFLIINDHNLSDSGVQEWLINNFSTYLTDQNLINHWRKCWHKQSPVLDQVQLHPSWVCTSSSVTPENNFRATNFALAAQCSSEEFSHQITRCASKGKKSLGSVDRCRGPIQTQICEEKLLAR